MQIRRRILILCEDSKSSLYYFNSFKKDEYLKRKLSAVTVEVVHPVDYSPLGLVKNAIQRKKEARKENNEYDEIWVILDKDEHSRIPDAVDLARRNQINFGISIICFEYWILLHFKYTRKAFYNCRELIKDLLKHFPKYTKCNNCFNDLMNKIPDAIKNGEKLEKALQPDIESGKMVYEFSAYTNLHKLVKTLYDPDGN